METNRHPTLPRLFTVRAIMSAIDAVRPHGFYFAGEMHDFWEIVYILEGEVNATADDRVYDLKQGQMIFHRPMEFHRIWSAGGTAPHLLILSFDATGEGMAAFERQIMRMPLSAESRMRAAVQQGAELLRLEKEGRTQGPAYSYAAQTVTNTVEALLLELLPVFREHSAAAVSQDSETYRRIVRVLDANCERNLREADVAALCHCSVSNMKRVFRKYADKGVMHYFTWVKIRRAIQLLEEGLTITQVSDRLGFSSPSYFTVVFKRETGYTPKDYRRRLNGTGA